MNFLIETSKLNKINSFIHGGFAYDVVCTSEGEVRYIIYDGVTQKVADTFTIEIDGKEYAPTIEDTNSPIVNLPTGIGKDKSVEELYTSIHDYLTRAVVFPTPEDAAFATAYAFCTWVYDEYHHFSYLSLAGLPGCGKSCALTALSNVSYNSVMASGADTDAAVRRCIDVMRGTFCCDESQKSSSDPNSQFHRILAVGNTLKGAINLCETIGKTGEIKLRAFYVGCPKIFAGRSTPGDEAILSRTFEILFPILPAKEINVESVNSNSIMEMSIELKNDLLLFRQKRKLKTLPKPSINYRDITGLMQLSPREAQVYEWILTECSGVSRFSQIQDAIKSQKSKQKGVRKLHIDCQVLSISYELLKNKKALWIPLTDIAASLLSQGFPTHSKTIGKILRQNSITIDRKEWGMAGFFTKENLTHVFSCNQWDLPGKDAGGDK